MSVEHSIERQSGQASWQDKLTPAARRKDAKLRKQHHRSFMRNGFQDVRRVLPTEIDQKITQSLRYSLEPLRPIDVAREIASTLRDESSMTTEEVAIAYGVVLPAGNWEQSKTIKPDQLVFEPDGFTIYIRDASK